MSMEVLKQSEDESKLNEKRFYGSVWVQVLGVNLIIRLKQHSSMERYHDL